MAIKDTDKKLNLIRIQDGGRVWLKEVTRGHYALDVMAPIYILRLWPGRQVHPLFGPPLGFHVPDNDGLWGPNDQFEKFNKTAVRNIIRDHMMVSRKTFDQLIEMGVHEEVAQIVLPVATYNQRLIAMRLPDIFEFTRISMREPPQANIRVYSKALLQLAWEATPGPVGTFMQQQWPKHDGPVFDLAVE